MLFFELFNHSLCYMFPVSWQHLVPYLLIVLIITYQGPDILQVKSKNKLICNFEQNHEVCFFFVSKVQNSLAKQTFRKSSLQLVNAFLLPLVRGNDVMGHVILQLRHLTFKCDSLLFFQLWPLAVARKLIKRTRFTRGQFQKWG